MNAPLAALGRLARLESEAVEIIREAYAEAENPVLLFSGGKDSTVLAELAIRAFHPARPPVPLLHVDSTWEFREVAAFRDAFAARHGFALRVEANEEGRRQGLNPIEHGDTYTSVMRTDALKQALDKGGYDVIFGGARRDEEASRAKERIVSVRGAGHSWEPRRQRPELWSLYNLRRSKEQSLRVYPLSNWTERDLWAYIAWRGIDLCPLYFAAERPVVTRGGLRIVVDDPDHMIWEAEDRLRRESVRFRTLGCWPVTAAVPSTAETLDEVIAETLSAKTSERQGRVSDGGSLERQKREGYF